MTPLEKPSGHPILHPIICGGKGKRMRHICKEIGYFDLALNLQIFSTDV